MHDETWRRGNRVVVFCIPIVRATLTNPRAAVGERQQWMGKRRVKGRRAHAVERAIFVANWPVGDFGCSTRSRRQAKVSHHICCR